jgi:hypothetical protein
MRLKGEALILFSPLAYCSEALQELRLHRTGIRKLMCLEKGLYKKYFLKFFNLNENKFS